MLQQIWLYLKVRKKYWLVPLLLCLLALGGLLVMGQGSFFTPFLYTLF